MSIDFQHGTITQPTPLDIKIIWVVFSVSCHTQHSITDSQFTAIYYLEYGRTTRTKILLKSYLCSLCFNRDLLVASRRHFSGRYPCHSGLRLVPFPKKHFADKMERCCCADTKFKCYIKCNESPEIFRGWGDVMRNHDADRKACLNRQILNNSVKRKAMEDLCERPHKLIHKELRSQQLDTLTYKDIRNISRNMHKASFSQQMLKKLTKHSMLYKC